jgi:minor extracellular serine protease Vpr
VKPRLLALISLVVFGLFGQDLPTRTNSPATSTRSRLDRWILILEAPPVADQIHTRAALLSAQGVQARSSVLQAQAPVRRALAQRHIAVMGSTQVVANALFVHASAEEAAQLRRIPGVSRVVLSQPARRADARALDLVRAPEAWQQGFGGPETAGAGIRIGIIDTGIDQTHAAFQDDTLADPPGGRLCVPDDCAYTNNKVIAVRSYVRMLAYPQDPLYSRPDDLTPRDRVGHGTAVAMLAAGVRHESPMGTLSGVAPKSYLGNYKIFGSPGVNDVTFSDVIMQALEDALLDGMDVVTLSLEVPAVFGPLDKGPACGESDPDAPCDLQADAVQKLSALGVSVVVAAGNEGDSGLFVPAQGSVTSPGTAPSAITVGASTNSHQLFNTVSVAGDSAPAELQGIWGLFGDGPRTAMPLTAPLVNVSTLEDNGEACSALPRASLNDSIAAVMEGGCGLKTKLSNTQNAGAIALLLIRKDGRDYVYSPAGLAYTGIPLMLIGSTNGQALLSYLNENPGMQVTLDPSFIEAGDPNVDLMSYFSSYGPATGTNAIKPEIVAPGTGMYVATQSMDPQGDMYNASGYTAVQGTSFAVPLVAGAAALSRQLFPDLPRYPASDRPAALKSSIVNTANSLVYDFDSSGNTIYAGVTAMGSGKLDTVGAVLTPITVAPSTLSFGVLNMLAAPPSQSLVFTNHTNVDIKLTLTLVDYTTGVNRANLEISPASFSLAAGSASQPVRVAVPSTVPPAGVYEGIVQVLMDQSQTWFQIPFLYVVGDGIPYNLIPLRNYDFVGQAGQFLGGGLLFKVVDRYGAPVPNVPVQWQVVSGGGEITRAYPTLSDSRTDSLGIAEASEVYLGQQLGNQVIEAVVENLPALQFIGVARQSPLINGGGVVNAASGEAGDGLAAGSIASITGQGLAELTLSAQGASLPLALGGVSVSFDDPARGISVPGHLSYVSDERVDVQLPWELQGVPSVQMKVSIDAFTSTPLYDLKLANVGPALWTYRDPYTDQVFAEAYDEAGQRVGSQNRAVRGAVLRLRANGLGAVDNTPASGEPAPAGQTANILGDLRIMVGDVALSPQSAVLLEGSVGIYDVAFVLTGDVLPGAQPVVITVSGVASKAATILIKE